MITDERAKTEIERAENEKRLKEYLGEQKIFIVDTSSASRRRLAKAMIDLGAKASQVILHGNYEEAEAALKATKPKVVLSDFMLQSRSGLDLLQTQRQAAPEVKD